MPLLDVSDLLDDPDFADDTGTLYLRRATVEVGPNGRAVEAPAQVPLDGVVQPASGNQLTLLRSMMLPEGMRAEGAITVYTHARLYVLGRDQAPDQIEWKGQTYTVTALADWTDYGAGFSAAICTLKDFAETPLD